MFVGKKKRLCLSILILACFLVLTIGPSSCFATEVWSDDFNDGNYDGWTPTEYGGGSLWSAAENNLQINQETIGAIAYESTMTTGTWSVDIQCCETTDMNNPFDMVIFFMIDGCPPTGDPSKDWKGYAVQVSPALVENEFIHIFSIRKKSVEMRSATRALVLDSYEGGTVATSWYHIDITRTSNGQITAFLNGTQILQAFDTDYESSDYFALVGTQYQCFDNVVVDDQLLPVGPPLEILALGAGAAVILVVAVTIILRRR